MESECRVLAREKLYPACLLLVLSKEIVFAAQDAGQTIGRRTYMAPAAGASFPHRSSMAGEDSAGCFHKKSASRSR